jgi:hypothetical protein
MHSPSRNANSISATGIYLVPHKLKVIQGAKVKPRLFIEGFINHVVIQTHLLVIGSAVHSNIESVEEGHKRGV